MIIDIFIKQAYTILQAVIYGYMSYSLLGGRGLTAYIP